MTTEIMTMEQHNKLTEYIDRCNKAGGNHCLSESEKQDFEALGDLWWQWHIAQQYKECNQPI